MWLLNTSTYRLEVFDGDIPKYAMLSHRWSTEEVTYQDYYKLRKREWSGYSKIIQACDFARSRSQDWLWVDTCCIDKKSSAELSEAINSMFDWYREAEECYAYLVDVRPITQHSVDETMSDFRASDWFNRGWTLQELLAPSLVVFCARNWEVIGVKDASSSQVDGGPPVQTSLNSTITEITGIPEDILRKPSLIRRRSVAQRLSWASRRRTTRIEDQAYCLLGLFNVNMPLLYGERSRSFVRLQQEILQTSLDESLLAWTKDPGPSSPLSCLLADSPAAFSQASNIEGSQLRSSPRFMLAGGGLLEFRPDGFSEAFEINPQTYALTLRCMSEPHNATFCANDDCSHPNFPLVVTMCPCGHFERVHFSGDLDAMLRPLIRLDPEIMYMHVSPASRCSQLADFV